MSLLPAPPVQAGAGGGEGVPHRSCAGTQGPWESWLTDEPDSLPSQGLLPAVQVMQALAQVGHGPAPLLGQLERGEGCRVGAELPPRLAIPPPRAIPLPPSRTSPAPHCVAPGFRGSIRLPGMQGCHPSGRVPLGTPGAKTMRSRACSRRVCAAKGAQPSIPAPSPQGTGQGLPGEDPRGVGALLTRHSLIFHACPVSAMCASCLHFRNRPALRRASWEAW